MQKKPHKSYPRNLSAVEKRRKIFEMRKAGLTYRQIADRMDMSVSTIHEHVKKELATLNKQNQELAGEYRLIQLQRLESLLVPLQQQIANGHLTAIDKARRIMDSISQLMGANAPAKVAATTPDGEEAPTAGVVVVPAVSGSVDDWMSNYAPKDEDK